MQATDTDPEALGIPSRALLALIDALERQGLDPHALIVARRTDDQTWSVGFAGAWAPYEQARPALVYSVSKTFTSLAIGFLEAEGRLSLDDSVGDLLGLPNPNGLTVRHLLTMNSGHSPEQIDGLRFDVRALLSVAPAATPGTRFAYNSDATFALSCIVTALTGERLTDYLRPRLLDPLGIGRRWMKPARGLEQGFSGFHLTVDDIARTAMLLADGGRRAGVQVVPATYVDELSRPWSDTREPGQPDDPTNDWALGYGFQVWRSTRGFRLDGAYGQFGLVLRDRGLVIAYQGATTDTQRTLHAIWDLVDAVTDEPAAVDAAAVAALGERAALLDTWAARDVLAGAPDGGLEVTGWRLEDETDEGDGWRLQAPTGERVTIGADAWTRATLPWVSPPDTDDAVVTGPPVPDGTHVPVAVRGERDADGILVHLVVTTSPHRLILRRGADGALTAAWHTVPLQGSAVGTLAVPEWLAD